MPKFGILGLKFAILLEVSGGRYQEEIGGNEPVDVQLMKSH